MSKHNIVKATFALLDDNGDLIKDATKGLSADGIYVADHQGEGFSQINVTAIEAAGTPGWGNGQIKRTAYGKSMPTLALTALDLDFKINQMLKGYTQNTNTGAWVRQLPKPHVAMIAESQSLDGDISIYECFNNIEFVEEASNNSTDTNNEAAYSTVLNGTVLTPLKSDIFLAANGVQQPYMIAKSNDANFSLDKLMAETFGGYTKPASGTTGGTTSGTTQG
ncbi:Phage major tail protein [Lactiplantibacillus plantarum]|uniref:phage tail protein n=1 Tax=Lactiplantibacillus plantarum TaxID=1590 RepID=UPI0007605E07|nr:phage tail protein [Lactiplantibacillus plantarum]AWI40665.1 phage tail protein [Lactiplantibacillus plantarum]KWT45150.1 phage tail protein [Lactiplantibacillus plantarum]KZT94648.1 Phage major tail protein [Lactiplantibacillus plantarum]MBO2703604.1 phage tail protein [Lactiplantibacillus plantarum]MBO2709331.1 phage tail protein [Lactiplantibacillus plantarum]